MIKREKLFASQDDIWKSIDFERWNNVYNNLGLMIKQGLNCGPIGSQPNAFPVIIKPIISTDKIDYKNRVCSSVEHYNKLLSDGLIGGTFWMPFLEGNEYCVDMLYISGHPVFAYKLDYIYNPDFASALSNIRFTMDVVINKLPMLSSVINDMLGNYTGPVSISYIGNNVVSVKLRWSSWSEYIWMGNMEFEDLLDKILKMVNIYGKNPEQNLRSVLNNLVKDTLGGRVISCVPLYLKNNNLFDLAFNHWTVICNKLGCQINWLYNIGELVDNHVFMPMIGVILSCDLYSLKKIEKYKNVSQNAGGISFNTTTNIPVVY